MRSSFAILFFIKKTKLLKTGEAPIYVRLTINGMRAESSLKRSISTTRWISSKGLTKGFTKHEKDLNRYIEHTRHQIYKRLQDLEERNKIISAKTLMNAYHNNSDDVNSTIIKLYKPHNEDLKAHINKGVSENTYKRHMTSMNHLAQFIDFEYKMADYFIKDINPEFIKRYQSYLRIQRNCNNNTTVKYIKNFSKIVRIALDNGWINQNPFRSLRFHLEEVERQFLNDQELDAIIEKDFKIQRIAQIRDVFIFCCFTGLAFVDVKSLTMEDISVGPNQTIWLRKRRHKTKQWDHIPILPKAQEILEKYKHNKECNERNVLLPVPSNQKMNAYLKEIADLCGIDKNLTTHCARHTFGTTVTLANNVSLESVSKMLGHTNLSTTKKYAKIMDKRIAEEMVQVAKNFDKKVIHLFDP